MEIQKQNILQIALVDSEIPVFFDLVQFLEENIKQIGFKKLKVEHIELINDLKQSIDGSES